MRVLSGNLVGNIKEGSEPSEDAHRCRIYAWPCPSKLEADESRSSAQDRSRLGTGPCGRHASRACQERLSA